MVLDIFLKREMTGLKLSQCSRLDTQILISIRMAVNNKSNHDACEELSSFEGHCRLLVRLFVLRSYSKNSQGCFLLSTRPYFVYLVKSHGVVIFSEM